MTKRTSSSFIGRFDPNSSADMLKLEEIRGLVRCINKSSNVKHYVKLQGRGKNRLERSLPYYNKKYGESWVSTHIPYIESRVAMSLPVEVSEYFDAYIYKR